MAIYMDFEGIKGSVTEGGKKGLIPLATMAWGCTRAVDMKVGEVKNRSTNQPAFNQLSITKAVDESSTLLFQSCVTNTTGKKVLLYFMEQAGSGQEIWYEYELQGAFISAYYINGASQGKPNEAIEISYTYIKMKFIPTDPDHKGEAPVPAGYDLKVAAKV